MEATTVTRADFAVLKAMARRLWSRLAGTVNPNTGSE